MRPKGHLSPRPAKEKERCNPGEPIGENPSGMIPQATLVEPSQEEAEILPLPRVPAVVGSGWLREAVHNVLLELALFFRTAAAITFRPRRFAAEWGAGEVQGLNPLAFLATSLAITGPILILSERLPSQAEANPLWRDLVSPLGPYAQFLVLGLLCHAFLRLLGGRRGLLATVGISLYAGGGPAAAVDLVTLPLQLLVDKAASDPDTLFAPFLQGLGLVSVTAANVAFVVTFALGVAGMHGVRLWRPALALMGSYLLLVALRVGIFTLLAVTS
jgi:hypothetical protein